MCLVGVDIVTAGVCDRQCGHDAPDAHPSVRAAAPGYNVPDTEEIYPIVNASTSFTKKILNTHKYFKRHLC